MLVTLALVVFCAAIFVVFSQEFIRIYKRLFAIKGVSLFVPLLLVSWFVYFFDYWVLWAIYYYREVLQSIMSFLISLMPFRHAQEVFFILLLTAISVVPVVILDLLSRHETYKPYPYPYITSTLIWIFTAVVLIVI